MPSYNCPQCGDRLNIEFSFTKLTRCPSCGSTLLLEDENISSLGESSSLIEEETLFAIGKSFRYRKQSLRAIGKIRYQHEYGFWEEWFMIDTDTQDRFWLSVDEGDFILEKRVPLNSKIIKKTLTLPLGKTVRVDNISYRITEKGRATCVGFEGELPYYIEENTILEYIHLTPKGKGEHLTLERDNIRYLAYQGVWMDPYEIEVIDG